MDLNYINTIYNSIKEPRLHSRYITNESIENCIKKYPELGVSTFGYSVENRPIYSLKIGTGKIKVLLWSQMHGNESTTTKALFDCFNFFETQNEYANSILKSCTLLVVPILNPDGAARYTRLNANNVDLNRDAQDLSQPESRVLREVYSNFQPNYCFNLHGQRTIFGAGDTGIPATLSFLSPSQDEKRSLTINRKQAMAIIAEINKTLQTQTSIGLGRYDDSFNLNCVGDTFQSFGVPTLLYEAGHYKNDYDREEVRRFIFVALLKGLLVISEGYDVEKYEDYFKIPSNEKCFYDIIVRNAVVDSKKNDVAFQYEERLVDGKIDFVPKVEVISDLDGFFGHREIDANGLKIKSFKNSELKVANEIDFVLINDEKIALKPDYS
ncbi:M14 family zinc carboxypeptidase [Winogradskyella ursingii]|uniref:M14 family zinc carboxypeptidase n=1 Tax=Winogradskyella ursingii TaxID=2686079 RepID=UPI0015CDFD50|nr:DUF2817 domain-containing protein [Winogradskyella ursingii]